MLGAGLLFGVFAVWAAAKQAPPPPVIINNGQGEQVQLYSRSYALVIGVSDYMNGWKNLEGVKIDIAAVKTALEQHGFEVTTLENPTGSEFRAAFERFIEQHGREFEHRIIVYFAGHGWTLTFPDGRAMGYLVPSDAPLPQDDQIGFEHAAVDMKTIELYATKIQSKHALFMFDSCFSGAVFYVDHTRAQTSVPPVISYKAAQPVRQLITSGSEAERVPDQSIFREQFVAALNGEGGDLNYDGYLTGEELGMFLENQVINYSYATQHPQYGTIRDPKLDKGDMVFQFRVTPPQFELIVTDGRRVLSPVNGVYTLRIGETVKLRITNVDRAEPPYEIRWQGGGEKGSGRLMLPEGETNMYTAQRRGNDYVRVRVYQQGTAEAVESLFVLIRVL